ncbi:GGDEF domain-containing protein [Roseateles albus]|uniref:diguanylate cyclase n=1 Tax=Roseateles albus TaxID=2987525 RepID=A0ABT5KAS8_9BURK|nr:GGDEF domain-containing protein [Roseateles albus]
MSQRPLSSAAPLDAAAADLPSAAAATPASARLGSIRLRLALAVVSVSLLLVCATDALHLRYQMQQQLAFEVGQGSLPGRDEQAKARGLVYQTSSDLGTGPNDLGRQSEALQRNFWREQLPAMLWRDLSLVLLLSLVLIFVLDRMLLRPLQPLRRLASHADTFDSTLPPPQEPLQAQSQPNELARISHSITRAQQSLWLQLQEEQARAEQLRLEVSRQQEALRSAEQSLAQKNLELGRLSRIDELTGLANRREFDEGLRREFKRAQRQRGHLALAVLDLDHFKNFNERYGVAAGDAVLARFAQLLSVRFKRDTDLVARLGGEEFVALLPGFGLDVTQGLLEQLREDLRELKVPHEGGVSGRVLTVSVGLAAYSPAHPYLSPHALMQAADEALYIAKHAGRDRLSLAASSGHP